MFSIEEDLTDFGGGYSSGATSEASDGFGTGDEFSSGNIDGNGYGYEAGSDFCFVSDFSSGVSERIKTSFSFKSECDFGGGLDEGEGARNANKDYRYDKKRS